MRIFDIESKSLHDSIQNLVGWNLGIFAGFGGYNLGFLRFRPIVFDSTRLYPRGQNYRAMLVATITE